MKPKIYTLKDALRKAHRMGVVQMKSKQLLFDRENMIVIFKAKVKITKPDGAIIKSTAHGDATVKNVNKMIIPHVYRMAESRAYARALRFATNIGEPLAEELHEDKLGGVVG